jgi:hypothetical protein
VAVTEIGDKVYDLSGPQRIELGTYRVKIDSRHGHVTPGEKNMPLNVECRFPLRIWLYESMNPIIFCNVIGFTALPLLTRMMVS